MKIGVRKKGLQDVVTFGRWNGKTLQTVLEEDPDYIVWMYEHVGWFPIEDEVYETALYEINNHPYDVDYWTPWRSDPYAPWWDDGHGNELI